MRSAQLAESAEHLPDAALYGAGRFEVTEATTLELSSRQVARRSASIRNPEGDLINPVDIARVLNRHGVYVQHECVQRADGSIDLTVQPLAGMDPKLAEIEAGLREYFGARQVSRLGADAALHERKVGKALMYRSEM